MSGSGFLQIVMRPLPGSRSRERAVIPPSQTAPDFLTDSHAEAYDTDFVNRLRRAFALPSPLREQATASSRDQAGCHSAVGDDEESAAGRGGWMNSARLGTDSTIIAGIWQQRLNACYHNRRRGPSLPRRDSGKIGGSASDENFRAPLAARAGFHQRAALGTALGPFNELRLGARTVNHILLSQRRSFSRDGRYKDGKCTGVTGSVQSPLNHFETPKLPRQTPARSTSRSVPSGLSGSVSASEAMTTPCRDESVAG